MFERKHRLISHQQNGLLTKDYGRRRVHKFYFCCTLRLCVCESVCGCASVARSVSFVLTCNCCCCRRCEYRMFVAVSRAYSLPLTLLNTRAHTQPCVVPFSLTPSMSRFHGRVHTLTQMLACAYRMLLAFEHLACARCSVCARCH